MEREFYLRGKKVRVEQLTNVIAVRPESPDERGTTPEMRVLGEAVMTTLEAVGVPDEERRAFQQAGWMFIRPSAEGVRAVESHSPPQGAAAVGHVFLDASGRTLIETDRLTVKLRETLTEDEALQELAQAGLTVVRRLRFAPNLYEVRVRPGVDPIATAVHLHDENDAVTYAEPELIEHVPGRLRPTDPDYSNQWHLRNDGTTGGISGADISAELAWDSTQGEGIRVAIIDNGFDVRHPDLSSALHPRTGYFRPDAQGGADFVASLSGFPDSDHGTFCAGMAVATADNGLGGCGVAHQGDLILIACLNDQVGTQVALARAVAYAADPSMEDPAARPEEGAHVISCSLGPNNAPWRLTSVLEDALTFATSQGREGLGTPILWAVDNATNPVANDQVCSHPTTIAVGRSTNRDMEDGSAFGPELDFLAPGVRVFSTTSGGGYGVSTGTSFATPCAAGVAALVLSVNPNLTVDEVRQILRSSCDKVGGVTYDSAGRHDRYGFGRANAAGAVQLAVQARQPSTASPV